MKTFRRYLLSLVGLAVLTAPLLRAVEPATTSPDRPERSERKEDMRDGLKKRAKALNLTPDQEAKMGVILKETAEAGKALRADTTLSKEQRREAAGKLRESSEAKIDAILTPEQRTKAAEMREKRGRMGGDRPGHKKPDAE